MKTMHHPLSNLRNSLQSYLENPEQSSGKLYSHAMGAILQMHDAIADFMLSGKDNSVLQRYMRTLQEQIRLSFDDIPYSWVEKMNLLEEENPNEELTPQYNICYECFRLIREMQLAYPTFFDDRCIPPIIYLVLEKSRHHHNWALVSRWFNKKRKKYNRIWEIIDSYIEHLWDVNQRFSYGEIAYGFNFVDQLMHNIRARAESFDSKALYSFLIYMNFNDIAFLQHITTDVKDDMDGMIDFEKITLLEDFQQEIESAMVRTDCILDKGNPSISTMLTEWIKRELKSLQT